jgi:hypothetical protein
MVEPDSSVVTRRSRPVRAWPVVAQRFSSAWLSSGTESPSGSCSASTASRKSTPCLRRFVACFVASQVILGGTTDIPSRAGDGSLVRMPSPAHAPRIGGFTPSYRDGAARDRRGGTRMRHRRPMDAYRRFINRELPWEERSCTSKAQFVTRDEARSYLRSGIRTSGSALRPYHCPMGCHWHLGHRRRRHNGADVDIAPRHRRGPAAGGGPDWLSRDWWSTRPLDHFRPARGDRSWREAWSAA